MAIPVINTTTSVLGYKQWQEWVYQPYATNSPTSWACANLPTGITINATTGKISGASEAAGVFVCGLTASNADGTSDPLVLTIGIEEAAAARTSSGVEVRVDVATRSVTTAALEKADNSAQENPAPLLYCKEGDSLLLWVTFVKDGTTLDLDLSSLKLVCKEYETEGALVSGDDFQSFGFGSGSYYGLYVPVESAALTSALANYENESGTFFDAIAEIEWMELNPNFASGFGPAAYKFSTQDFKIRIARDMVS